MKLKSQAEDAVLSIENRTRFDIKTTFALRILSRRQGDLKFHIAHVVPTAWLIAPMDV